MNIAKALGITSSALLLGSGCFLLSVLGTAQLQEQQALAHPGTITTKAPMVSTKPAQVIVSGTPVHISVPSVNVDATINPGTYNPKTGTWTLSEDAAFFATATQPANNISGNTFIYGHDSTRIFGNLRVAPIGALAYVTTDNGYVFTYQLQATKLVQPSDVSVLNYTSSPARLTLQTCPGVPNLTREMFFLTLVSYRKA